MTRVAILWHMHQPFYEDLVTHEHILPWVRLHALKDYYGMVAVLREFPDVRVTFNLVPSLLVQLEAFAADRARDRDLDLSLKPAVDLTGADIAFVLENFFHAQRQHMIEVYPRYAELLARRGGSMPASADRRAAAARFTADDLRDLQVWHKLAWIDPVYLTDDARVAGLVAKDRHFTEEDKALLRTVELELLNRVIPEYRDAAAREQIEISTSPFYHPILPLLCDSNVYLRTHPETRRPRQRFTHPEDAADQLDRAIAFHERLFGRRPRGVWPSEGSVSDAMVPLVAAAGFTWMATDELILSRSLEVTFSRDAHGHVEQPERLYAPYRVGGEAGVACLFRDHLLSDLIGFTYSGWSADRAADDFVGRLVEAGRRFSARTGGGEATIAVILDGENAWEHFEGGGRPFLRALYGRLSHHAELRTVTMADACAEATRELPSIFPGSWIDGNFYIWIGHQDDQLAWSQLADARAALDGAASDVEEAARAQAREEVLIAEGSDWFWWYGDDHSSAHDLEFDNLFRRHLRNVYRLLKKPVPDELFVSNISHGAATTAQTQPSAWLSPAIDGDETSYFEWLGAGLLEIRDTGGAMHRTDRRQALLSHAHFGFDRAHLFLRLDAVRDASDLLGDGYEFSLKFINPDGVRISIRHEAGRPSVRVWHRHPESRHWVPRGETRARVAVASIVELSVPLAELGLAAGDALLFFVAMYDTQNVEIERHPEHRPIEVTVPDDLFETRNWSA